MTTNCFVCYDNLLTSPLVVSVVVTSERAGYSVQNCYDWNTTTYWSPASAAADYSIRVEFSEDVTVDYLAIFKHNLATVGGVFFIEYSHNNWVTYTLATPLLTVDSDNELNIDTFEPISAKYWQVTFRLTSATPFYVGVVMFGQKLPLYRGMVSGFTVPRHGRKNEIINQKTEGGQFVGRVKTSQGARTSINFKHVTQSWVRANWEVFVRHAELLPFLFSWNHDTYPQDAVYCVTDGEIPHISINDNHHHDINLPVQCLLSGDAL